MRVRLMCGLRAAIVTMAVAASIPSHGAPAQTLDGITFAAHPDTLYAPVREIGDALGWPVRWDADEQAVYLNGSKVPKAALRHLRDDTTLIRLRDLRDMGASVVWDRDQGAADVSVEDHSVAVRNGEKRVVVNLTHQKLKAWQGKRLVLEADVSTGKPSHRTTTGAYRAGPMKQKVHYSTIYDNARMPYSVQITGNVFIHGYSYVPDEPDSHGCIRMHLDRGNPAQWFYDWVEIGTPITVKGRWS